MQPHKLTLFVSQNNLFKAKQRLAYLLSGFNFELYSLEILEIDQEHNKAKKYNIMETPALVCHHLNQDLVFESLDDRLAIRYALGLE